MQRSDVWLHRRAGKQSCWNAPAILGRAAIVWLLIVANPAGLAPATALDHSPAAPSCRGVDVGPDTDLQRQIDGRPRGTRFCFSRGVYRLSTTIRTGQKFPILDLRAGAILDGGDGSFVGISGADAPGRQRGTTILGGTFQHFGNAEAPDWISPVVVQDNGVIAGTEFRENFNAGLTIQGDNVRVSKVYTHHNGRYGLVANACSGCPGPRGVIIEDSEIAFNNTRQLATDGDAGGTKFSAGTRGMVVRRNEVHDNYGAGLWWDGYNTNANIYGNVIYDNRTWGILWELSYGGVKIHDNELVRNAVSDGIHTIHSAQIVISNSDGTSGGIEVYGNRIVGTAHALTIVDGARPIMTTHVRAHHNMMILRASDARVGAESASGTEIFTAESHNRFANNIYRVEDVDAPHWVWSGQTLTWREWRDYGHDVEGQLRAL